MSRNEDITTGIWDDPGFADLPPDAKLVFLWSFTNEHNGMSGLYQVREATISYETGLTAGRLTAALEAVAQAELAWHLDNVMFVRSRVKRLRTKSPQIATSIARDVTQIRAEHPLRCRFLEVYGNDEWLYAALDAAHIFEAHTSLTGASPEPQANLDSTGDSVSLTGASPEAPLSGPLSGSGSGNGVEGSGEKGRRRAVDQSKLPDGFPDDGPLPAVAIEALTILHRTWDLRGGLEPKLRGVGLALLRNPKAGHVQVALQLEQWLTAGKGQRARCADVTARFADWVAQEPAANVVAIDKAPAGAGGKFAHFDKAAGLQ